MSAAPELKSRTYTAEELWELASQGHRYELVRGELREMTPGGPEHGNTAERLGGRASVFAEDQGLGEPFTAETGFLIARDPDVVLAPDWAYIARERLPEQWARGFCPVVPDIVVEVRSPGDTGPQVAAKVAQWLDAGVRLAWEVDPAARVVRVHRPGVEPRTLGLEDELSGEEVLPGFAYPLRRLFRPPGARP